MKRFAVLMFGASVYAMFLGVFLYAVGFVGNFLVPTRLDGVAKLPIAQALVINLLLLALFAVQHSVMARPWFKKSWTRFVPEPIERSTYVLCTNVVLALLYWQWQPIGGAVWDVQHLWGRAMLYGLFAFGWLTVLVTTFLINHFDLFGLRQVWLYFRGKHYTSLGFVTPGPYRFVRHPMYIGWLMAFWATPTMTFAHLTFALGITAYILTAIYFEERDLMQFLGQDYADYRKNVPMLIPRVSSHTESPRPCETATMIGHTASLEDSAVSLRHPVGNIEAPRS
jgi:protein-S-isoprenylcysteine O-methyltransferase Ste14